MLWKHLQEKVQFHVVIWDKVAQKLSFICRSKLCVSRILFEDDAALILRLWRPNRRFSLAHGCLMNLRVSVFMHFPKSALRNDHHFDSLLTVSAQSFEAGFVIRHFLFGASRSFLPWSEGKWCLWSFEKIECWSWCTSLHFVSIVMINCNWSQLRCTSVLRESWMSIPRFFHGTWHSVLDDFLLLLYWLSPKMCKLWVLVYYTFLLWWLFCFHHI